MMLVKCVRNAGTDVELLHKWAMVNRGLGGTVSRAHGKQGATWPQRSAIGDLSSHGFYCALLQWRSPEWFDPALTVVGLSRHNRREVLEISADLTRPVVQQSSEELQCFQMFCSVCRTRGGVDDPCRHIPCGHATTRANHVC